MMPAHPCYEHKRKIKNEINCQPVLFEKKNLKVPNDHDFNAIYFKNIPYNCILPLDITGMFMHFLQQIVSNGKCRIIKWLRYLLCLNFLW